MPQFSRQSLETFQTQLDEMDDDCSDSLNLRQFVGLSFESIQRARSRKASWEKIALILKETSGSTAAVSPQSIRQYYYEFLNHPERLGGKKRAKASRAVLYPDAVKPGRRLSHSKPRVAASRRLYRQQSRSARLLWFQSQARQRL